MPPAFDPSPHLCSPAAVRSSFAGLAIQSAGAGWRYGIMGVGHAPTAVPGPTRMIAGALRLLPFGVSTLRMLRKSRKA